MAEEKGIVESYVVPTFMVTIQRKDGSVIKITPQGATVNPSE